MTGLCALKNLNKNQTSLPCQEMDVHAAIIIHLTIIVLNFVIGRHCQLKLYVVQYYQAHTLEDHHYSQCKHENNHLHLQGFTEIKQTLDGIANPEFLVPGLKTPTICR